jgi:hypothetical protein
VAAVAFIVWGTTVSVRQRLQRPQPSPGPDYESFDSFYASDPTRRGDDVAIGQLEDDGYRWDLRWLPRTFEVVAFCVGWTNESAHLYADRVDQPHFDKPPELVHVLGRAATAADASQRVLGNVTIESVKAALGTGWVGGHATSIDTVRPL